MYVIKVLNPQIPCSTDKYLHCHLKNVQYVFIFCILFLGMPDKDSMSSSALCQVSKNCNKVNHTQFCRFFAGGGGIWLWKMQKCSIKLKVTECKCKACGWCIWIQYTNFKNALDILSFTEESSWFRIITQCTAAEVCVTIWFPGLCWKSAEVEEEKQPYDDTSR